MSSARDATALVRYALGVPFIRDALSRSTVSLPGGRTFPTTDDLLVSWKPARRRQDRSHARRRLVAGGRGREGRGHGLRHRARERHARNSKRRAPRAARLRPRPVPARAGDRRGAASTRRRRRGTASPTSTSSRRAPIVGTLRIGKPLVERVVAPTALALPVAKGQSVGRVEVYDGNRLVASSNLVAAEAVADAGFLAKAQWYASETVSNLWGIVT